MSRLNPKTKERIKEELLSRLTEEPKTPHGLAREINRSRTLVKDLLIELCTEKKTIGCMDLNNTKTYFIQDHKKPAFPVFR